MKVQQWAELSWKIDIKNDELNDVEWQAMVHKDQSLVIIYLLMTLDCSSPSGHLNSPPIFYTYKKIDLVSQWMSANFLSLNQFLTRVSE